MHINKSEAERLVEKWTPVLEFSSDKVAQITNDNTRLNTAILLENQEKWCLNEAGNSASTGGVFGTHQPTAGAFSGDRYAAGDARLPKVLIPMIRRTFINTKIPLSVTLLTVTETMLLALLLLTTLVAKNLVTTTSTLLSQALLLLLSADFQAFGIQSVKIMVLAP
jgi:hypothetical protein